MLYLAKSVVLSCEIMNRFLYRSRCFINLVDIKLLRLEAFAVEEKLSADAISVGLLFEARFGDFSSF